MGQAVKRVEQWRTHDGRKAAVLVSEDGTVTLHIDLLSTLLRELGWEEIKDVD